MSKETTVKEAEVKEQPTEETASSTSGPELTVNDLNQLKQVIDVASQRGTFKPNEMVAVGTIYNKLDMFLQAVSKQDSKGE